MSFNVPNQLHLPLQKNYAGNGEELCCEPVILDINLSQDFDYFKSTCENAILCDKVFDQLKELIKKRNPKVKFSGEEYAQLVHKHLNSVPIEKYGLWIYYPWSNKLIHIVNEDEFVELRTVRNCYKITPEEQAILKKKTIGVVGLSVGHAIALTIASERICGELRLADFDTLELTNLNRIKTGIQNLGLKKTVIAAREIAEIDPFLKVKCWHDGIDDDNIFGFLTGDGKLDLCLEECDDFYVKFSLRYKCRDLEIPVVMDTSDSGLIDIERFDLEPERKIFHGLSSTTNIESLRNLTTDQKIPYLYEIVNEHDMSVRLKASLVEVDETITGWPQLSSAVTAGSGMTTDVARRILLGELKKSGRFSADVEKIIQDNFHCKEKDYTPAAPDSTIYIQSIPPAHKNFGPLVDKNIIKNIVSDAIWAPSGGNIQPWKWINSGNSLIAVLDKERVGPHTDVNCWGAILALGCSVENAILSANKYGLNTQLKIPEPEENEFGVELNLTGENNIDAENIYDKNLVDCIPLRHTNRKYGENKSLHPKHKEKLINAVHSVPGSDIQIIEKNEDIAKVANLIAEGDIIRWLNKFMFHEMVDELRWNKNEAIEKPYGVEVDSLEISPKEKVGLKIVSSWPVASFVKKIGGKALGDISRKKILGSAALALITMPDLANNDFFNGGRAVERFWLTATKCNVAIHPMVTLNYFLMRLTTGSIKCFDQNEINTLKTLQRRWKEIFNSPDGAAEIFLCRVFYAAPAKEKSRRLAVNQILEFA